MGSVKEKVHKTEKKRDKFKVWESKRGKQVKQEHSRNTEALGKKADKKKI